MPQLIRKLFEEELARIHGSLDAIAVNSGTSALVASLWYLDLQPGDEIITTPFTFISTGNAILAAGGTPVFVDIREDDHLIDERLIEAAVTPRTKAILPVHLFGRVCRMEEILRIAAKYRLVVVEDAAQAFLSGRAGTFGQLGCFSFYKSKNLSTFEGGAILVNDSSIDRDKLRKIVDPGLNRHEGAYVGFNFRMPEPCALIGYERLKMHRRAIESEIGAYDERSGFYKQLLSDYPAFRGRSRGNCPVAEAVAKGIRDQD